MMKKILNTLFALVVAVMSACTNDDITIKTENPICQVRYTVRLQDMYDELDITTGVKDLLRDGRYSIGVTTLIYDANGELVDEVLSVEKSLNNVYQQFELKESTYTFITVETIVNSETKESDCWEIVDKENVSTVKINYVKGRIPNIAALGVATLTKNIASDISLDVTPEAVGSIVNACFFNYDKTQYTQVCVGCMDKAISYLLNPSLSERDRYVHDLTQNNHFSGLMTGDVNGDETICPAYLLDNTINWYMMARNDTFESEYWMAIANGNSELTNGGVIYVGSYYNSGFKDYKSFFGAHSNFLTWLDDMKICSVIVPELYTGWGGSVATVQSFMKGYTMEVGGTGAAVEQPGGWFEIKYKGVGNYSNITYCFTSAATGLYEANVFYEKSVITFDILYNWLKANYKEFPGDLGDTDSIMFFSKDNKSVAILYKNELNQYRIQFIDAKYMFG